MLQATLPDGSLVNHMSFINMLNKMYRVDKLSKRNIYHA